MKYTKLVLSILLCQAAGFIGSFFTITSTGSWYEALNKPAFNPPGWVFGPVWITLYLMMGISLYLVWEKGLDRTSAIVFGVQLSLNSLWSILFFGLKSPFLAFIEIIFLWAAILYTIIRFYPIDRRASYLLIPYLLWVSFASVLNLAIFVLNSG